MSDRTLLMLLLAGSLAVVSIPMACHVIRANQAVDPKLSIPADEQGAAGVDGQVEETRSMKARRTPSTARLGTLRVRGKIDAINKKSIEDIKAVNDFKRELGEKP